MDQQSKNEVQAAHVEGLNRDKVITSGDVATQLVDIFNQGHITPEQDRQCLRRIDLVLLPVMFLSSAFQYLDKACLTAASLFGIVEDLELYKLSVADGILTLDTQKYGYCSLIFYWGYLIGLIPGVYFSQRFPLGKYVAIVMFLWGGVTICTVAVNSYQGLLVQRFFLGVAEAGIAPAFSLITAMWYKRREQPLRFSIWFSATGISVLIGSLILYAIGHIHGRLAVWRYQFMIIGCFSSVWGICLWFLLPDSPLTAFFLSADMKVVAVERMRLEQSGIENKKVKWVQVKEAFTDPKTYFYMVMLFAINLGNGAATGFGSIIVKSFGYTTLRTMLLIGVAGVFVFVFTLGTGVISVFWRNTRCYSAMFCCLPVITGAVMIWQSNWQQDRAVPLWGFFMLTVFAGTQVMVLSLVAANTAGHTKKAVTSGLVWASYSTSNGIAPMLVKTQETAAHYPTSFITVIVMMSLVFVLLGIYRVYIFHLNEKRDRVGLVDMDEAARTGFLDMTDRENNNFRYQA